MSVSLRLFTVIALIFLLSSAGGAVIGYFDARQRIDTELKASMAVGKATAERSVYALANSFRPAGHLMEFVSLFDGDRHLQAQLVSQSGTLINESTLLAPENQVPDWFVWLFDTPPLVETFKLPGELANYAALSLRTDARNEIDEVWSSATVALLTLVLFICLVLTLVTLVIWHALRPVKPLLAAFDSLGTADDPGELRPFGPPEFRQLQAGFNAMARRLKQTERRNAALSQQIATVQDEERADLARDLHDEIGPLLFSIDVDAAAIRSMVGKTKHGRPIADRARSISGGAVAAKQQVRAILARLRPNLAAEIGLEQALIDLMAAERSRHPGIAFDESLSADCQDPVTSAAFYAVAREAIHNALKHAKPMHVHLSLRRNEANALELAIENDGGVLRPPRPDSQGLRNMRERIEALGGSFAVENDQPSSKVRIRAAVPAPATAKEPVE